MPRRFRLYGKKRGDRRTGSKRMGNYGELTFFLVFFVVGAVGLYVLVTGEILPQWEINRHFVEAQCVVLDTTLGEPAESSESLYQPQIQIRYQAGDKPRQQWTYDLNPRRGLARSEAEAIADRFVVGQSYPCWYDPLAPERVVLVRGYRWWTWLLLILWTSFAVIGGGGAFWALLQTGTSTERRAALVQRAVQLDLFDDRQDSAGDFPSVPRPVQVTDSPGTKLAYRLPVDAARGWMLGGIVLLCLLWNGIVAWLLERNVHEHLAGGGDWVMTVWLVPFVLAGLAILVLAARQLMLTTIVGATRMEISAHPLYPGESYDIHLSQTGWFKLHSLQVLLVCDESATYRQGTDTRTEALRVYQEQIYQCESIQIKPDMAFEDACKLRIPDEAMHSFQAGNNEVAWKLVVTGDVARWPDYERRFPVIVYPPLGRNAQP